MVYSEFEVFSGFVVFYLKQKTAYGMRISDWSSDVCSSDLLMSGAPGALTIAAQLVMTSSRPNSGAHPGWMQLTCASRDHTASIAARRSEERGVGKERVSTCRSRWARSH